MNAAIANAQFFSRRQWLLGCWGAGASLLACRAKKNRQVIDSPRLAALPPVWLWAWARPEDLRFINPTQVGVAILTNTLRLQGDEVHQVPRRQPCYFPAGTRLMAVVRIETDRQRPASLSARQLQNTCRILQQLPNLDNLSGLQLDFDATLSERPFYRQLLGLLRTALPARYLLSITALASWALTDNWLDALPIDEAVPMLFRLGVDRANILTALRQGKSWQSVKAQTSVGMATDEAVDLLAAAHTYLFNPQAWNPAILQIVARKLLLPASISANLIRN
jgi:Protein of unknown function (DUF3142)